MSTHYETLSVPRTASELQIKDAYRALVKKWHPDVAAEAGADAKFKDIQAAFDTLSDRRKRRDYDSELMVIETSGRPRDGLDRAMDLYSIMQEDAPEKEKRKRRKQSKQKRQKKAGVEIDEIPEGFDPDDTLGGILS